MALLPAGVERPPGRADQPVRGGRALAGGATRRPTQRLTHAWKEVSRPLQCRRDPLPLQIETAVDGLYALRLREDAIAMGTGALERRHRPWVTGSLIGGGGLRHCASAGRPSPVRSWTRAEHREAGAGPRSTGSPTRSWRRGSRRSSTSAGPRTISSTTTRRSPTPSAVSASRAQPAKGRLLIPMMLVMGYPLEIQGRIGEALRLSEAAVESARLSENPHYLFWALFELGWANYYLGDLDAAVGACEDSFRAGGRLSGATSRSASGGPGVAAGWASLFERGDLDRGFEDDGRRSEAATPRARDPGGALLLLGDPRPGGADPRATRQPPRTSWEGPRRRRRQLDLRPSPPGGSPGAVARRCCWRPVTRPRRPRRRSAGSRGRLRRDRGSRLPAGLRARAAGTCAGGGRRAQAGDRGAAPGGSGTLDECGSVRVARRGPARAAQAGRARSRCAARRSADDCGHGGADQAGDGDRRADHRPPHQPARSRRSCSSSKKTIESHIRNLFLKLDASSRVEVARIVERDRREQAAG